MATVQDYGELNPVGGGDPIPLLKPRVLIGRRSNCDVVLDFPNVSSQHCQLELTNGFWFVRDLNSRNGIKVNGERCDSHWLQPGDELSVARHVFKIGYQPAADAPPPQEEEDPLAIGLLEKAGLMRQQARPPRARSSRPVTRDDSKFTDSENDAARWLSDDEQP
ncbi:MAG: FHA domain-containing protein [Planctomycetaceae bacterium]